MKKLIFTLCACLFWLGSISSQTVQLEVEPNHSTVGFSLDIAGGITKITGKFTSYTIYLDYVNMDLTQSNAKIQIDASSIQTGIDARDEHLRTSDFFDVEKYPNITFESESIRKSENGYIMSGPFTMHGVTKNLEIPFQMTGGEGNTLGFSLETKVSRMDHGVGSEFKHTTIENFLAEEVDVHVFFWTKKRKTVE